MKYRGIEYEVKKGLGLDVWIWTIHTSPNARRGVRIKVAVWPLMPKAEALFIKLYAISQRFVKTSSLFPFSLQPKRRVQCLSPSAFCKMKPELPRLNTD